MVSHPETGSDSPIGSDRDRGRDTNSLLEYTKMSSMKTMTKRSKYGRKTRFIRSMKTAGALVSPKDITRNS